MTKENNKCAPSKSYSDGSCFTLDQLRNMAISFNKFVDAKQMDGNKITIDDNKRGLVLQLTNRLEKKCNDQLCWLKQSFVKALKDVVFPLCTYPITDPTVLVLPGTEGL